MEHKRKFYFCPVCGGPLEIKFLYGLDRLVCSKCGRIHFENPIVGAAAIIFNDEGKILLVKRGQESTMPGLWCIPCGFVEYDEDIRTAVVREAEEETGLQVAVDGVYEVHSNFHDPDQHTVGVWFLTHVVGGSLHAGDDAVGAVWSDLLATPPLAFPTDKLVLARLAEERKNGKLDERTRK